MSQLKILGIFSKRLSKYNSYHGTQGPIKPVLIKHNFSAIYPVHERCTDVKGFKFNGQKTYLSSVFDGCMQEVIADPFHVNQVMDRLKLGLA